jgi:hypothetical protein
MATLWVILAGFALGSVLASLLLVWMAVTGYRAASAPVRSRLAVAYAIAAAVVLGVAVLVIVAPWGANSYLVVLLAAIAITLVVALGGVALQAVIDVRRAGRRRRRR